MIFKFCPFQAYPQFVLTYLEDLTASVDVSQADNHIHHRDWTTAHQQHGSPSEEEVSVVARGKTDTDF